MIEGVCKVLRGRIIWDDLGGGREKESRERDFFF